MIGRTSYVCRRCGRRHDGLPFSYSSDAPVYWSDTLAGDEDSVLGDEQCIIQGQHFFVRGRIVIPVTDTDTDTEFDWGVWVSLSRANFERMSQVWTTPGRDQEPTCFGWLSTEIPIYEPTTVNLETRIHTRPVGERAVVELQPTNHPLAVEQRAGITLARVQRIAEDLLHPPT